MTREEVEKILIDNGFTSFTETQLSKSFFYKFQDEPDTGLIVHVPLEPTAVCDIQHVDFKAGTTFSRVVIYVAEKFAHFSSLNKDALTYDFNECYEKLLEYLEVV